MKIGIIVAMDKELQQLQHVLDPQKVILQKSGIGKVNAALQTAEMIRQYKPDCIISSGCAGGNGDDIHIQDVVVSTELTYHDVYCGPALGQNVYGQVQGLPARFQADPYLLEKAHQLSLSTHHLSLHEGLIVTGDWFVDTPEKMREISSHFPEAKAIDMESAAIAQTCYLHKVPFISFRVISDKPLQGASANQYYDFWTRIAENSFDITSHFVESLV